MIGKYFIIIFFGTLLVLCDSYLIPKAIEDLCSDKYRGHGITLSIIILTTLLALVFLFKFVEEHNENIYCRSNRNR